MSTKPTRMARGDECMNDCYVNEACKLEKRMWNGKKKTNNSVSKDCSLKEIHLQARLRSCAIVSIVGVLEHCSLEARRQRSVYRIEGSSGSNSMVLGLWRTNHLAVRL